MMANMLREETSRRAKVRRSKADRFADQPVFAEAVENSDRVARTV